MPRLRLTPEQQAAIAAAPKPPTLFLSISNDR